MALSRRQHGHAERASSRPVSTSRRCRPARARSRASARRSPPSSASPPTGRTTQAIKVDQLGAVHRAPSAGGSRAPTCRTPSTSTSTTAAAPATSPGSADGSAAEAPARQRRADQRVKAGLGRLPIEAKRARRRPVRASRSRVEPEPSRSPAEGEEGDGAEPERDLHARRAPRRRPRSGTSRVTPRKGGNRNDLVTALQNSALVQASEIGSATGRRARPGQRRGGALRWRRAAGPAEPGRLPRRRGRPHRHRRADRHRRRDDGAHPGPDGRVRGRPDRRRRRFRPSRTRSSRTARR